MYPLTTAFLHLLASLLERGFLCGPLPAYVLYCMHTLLPHHHQWAYKSGEEGHGTTRCAGTEVGPACVAGTVLLMSTHTHARMHAPPPPTHTHTTARMHTPSSLPGLMSCGPGMHACHWLM